MENINQLIGNSKSVAICTDKIADMDLANAIIALTKFLQNSGKAVGIIVKENPEAEIKELFEKRGVVYTNSATPLRYVVSIDYGKSGIEKVLHDVDEAESKVKFYIIPSGKKFDFEDVEYSQEGNDYDLTLTIGIGSFQQMGKIYESADYLFKQNKVISIAKDIDSLGDEFLLVGHNSTYSAVARDIIGERVDDEIREVLVDSLIQDLDLLEGGVDNEKLKILFDTAGASFDINEVLQRTYFSKTYKNLDLQIKLMTNIRVDKSARVLWSVVTIDDLKFAGVTRNTLDTKGRILFNISGDFDLAIAAYEVERTLFKIVVESNNPKKYSAANLAGVFEGRGNDRHASFVVKDTPRKDLEKNLFIVLENLYGIRISLDGAIEKDNSKNKAPEYGNFKPKDMTIASHKDNAAVITDGEIVEDLHQNSELPLTEPVVNDKTVGVNFKVENSTLDNTQKGKDQSEFDDLLD